MADFDRPGWLRFWDKLSWPWRIAAGAAGALLLGIVALGIFVIAVRPPTPDLQTVWQRRSEPSITILDKDDKLVMTRGGREGPVIPLNEMPDHLWQAFLAVEDRRFYEHGAVDPKGLLRALFVNSTSGRYVQGGSTITQQLAKNLFLTPERSIVRKVQEVWISEWLESHLSKDAILTLYLNRIYLGAGCYGVEAAAQFYFGKSAKDVSVQEAAMLAALPKAPTRLAPTSNLAAAQRRAEVVLAAMSQSGYIKPEQYAAALKDPAKPADTEQKDSANYFADWLIDQLWSLPKDEQEAQAWHDRNLVIHSTYDRALQQRAELAVMSILDDASAKKGAKQAAMVALDPSGAVRAMVGGKSYVQSQFNRAVQARRQPGSTFKPFVYLTALERGMTPYDTVDDAPITVDGWTPTNGGHEPQGMVTLATALAESINTATVRISEEVGPSNVVATARRLGIVSPLEPNASIALGTSEVSLLELAGAYIPFMDQGFVHQPFGIRSVTTDNAEKLFEREEQPAERAVAERLVLDMDAMLNGVVENGTGTAARLADGRPAAGKTGTTQDYRDAWFVGFTPQLLTGVWVGNDENQPMERIAGGTIPARLFKDFMDRALYGQEMAYLPTLNDRAHGEEPPVAEEQQQQDVAQHDERECHFLFFRVRC